MELSDSPLTFPPGCLRFVKLLMFGIVLVKEDSLVVLQPGEGPVTLVIRGIWEQTLSSRVMTDSRLVETQLASGDSLGYV